MNSTHTRNVTGMHAAPRCKAIARSGRPCRSPAKQGERHCRIHAGKGATHRSYAQRFGNHSKEVLARDRQTLQAIKSIEKVVRKLERRSNAREEIEDLQRGLRILRETIQQTQDDYLAAYFASSHTSDREKPAGSLAASSASHTSPEGFRDRVMGAMIGLAVGEAIGVTLHGQERDTYRKIFGMDGGGRLGLKSGEWSNATAMTLALTDSLIFRRRFNPLDFAGRLSDWIEHGAYSCTGTSTGIDETTVEALQRFHELNDPLSGEDNPDCNGNESLVRLAPVAIRFLHKEDELHRVAALQSRVTHASPYVIDACVTFSSILADAIKCSPRKLVLGPRRPKLSGSLDCAAAASWNDKTREQLGAGETVLTSLEAAMWCVRSTHTFEEAVLNAVNLGGPAAMLGALVGQLAGALYGHSAIPEQWIKNLAWSERIEERAEALLKQSS